MSANNAVAEIKPVDQLPMTQTLPAPNPVMEMIKQAVAAGQPLDVIRELKAMAQELAADEAQRAFNAAFAAFKSEAVVVVRNRGVTDGPLKGRKYAELFSFVDAAAPALARHGLSHSWSITKDEKDWIEVTCTIEHAMGGKKQVSQGGPPDAGGAKNMLQARISTVTYLERSTFKAACGLAEQGQDDDGAGGQKENGPALTEDQVMDLQSLVQEFGADAKKLCQRLRVEYLDDLPQSRLKEAEAMIRSKGGRS